MIFSINSPFYGMILSSLTKIPSKKVDTLGVGRSGNVFKLYYNPEFVSKLSTESLFEVLKHETLHIAFNHFTIFGNESVTPEEQKLRNIAADMEVNSYINTFILKQENIPAVTASMYNWDNCLGAREYYSRLLNKLQEEKEEEKEKGEEGGEREEEEENNEENNNNQQKDETGNSGKVLEQLKENGIDSHDEWDQCSTEVEEEMLNQSIDDILLAAEEEVAKSNDKIPLKILKKIEVLKERRKVKPVADWKRYCRRHLGNEFTTIIRKSKKRESKRFPGSPGNRKQHKSNILVAIDTSGSINMPDYIEFFNQINTLKSKANFDVIECDNEIRYKYKYNGELRTNVVGGGGTSFSPVVDYFIVNRRSYDALVYFTDGCAEIPHNTPKNTLWVISSDGDTNLERYRVNGASVVFIKKQKIN